MNLDVAESEAIHSDSVIVIDENEIADIEEDVWESTYYDASSMGPLSPISSAAIARLKASTPPSFPIWDELPLNRRAAVLILLFTDRSGDLRVVITMRAATLRNFAGHAAFPGGKADTLSESPFAIARREAFEEIGLPIDDAQIPYPFRIEHLCLLPCSLARTGLVVRPCVAFLYALHGVGKSEGDVEGSLIPRLDGREVAAVFSGGLRSFLKSEGDGYRKTVSAEKELWYEGVWTKWHGTRWRNHSFHVPVENQRVARPRMKQGEKSGETGKEQEQEDIAKYRVWGMTARMVIDAARIAYEEQPDFDYNDHIGDEEIIQTLQAMGRMEQKVPGAVELTEADWKNVLATQNAKGSSPSKI